MELEYEIIRAKMTQLKRAASWDIKKKAKENHTIIPAHPL
jgi:hypothetical protein